MNVILMCKLEANNVQVQELSDDNSDEAGSDSAVYVPSDSDNSDEGTFLFCFCFCFFFFFSWGYLLVDFDLFITFV